VADYRTECLCGRFKIGDYYQAMMFPFTHQIVRISGQGRYAYNENGASVHDCALTDEKYRIKELIGQ
jgi:hypothetical protein